MKSKVAAVICEMNPLHGGHLAILRAARREAGEDGTVIAVMSGNYVQRGTPAMFDRYTRAAATVIGGADLVLELPFPWSSASTAYFAAAGVEIASKASAEILCFGSVCGDSATLAEIAETAEKPQFQAILRDRTPEIGEATARETAFLTLLPNIPADIYRSPNDNLAIAYIAECAKRNLQWHAEKRVSGDMFPGASAIRRAIEDGGLADAAPFLAAGTFPLLEQATNAGKAPVFDGALAEYLFRIYAVLGDLLPAGAEGNGGVHERLVRCAAGTANGAEWLSLAATKKYTNARLRRAALFAVTGVTDVMLHVLPAYTTVLAANERGRQHLASLRKRDDFTVLTKPSDYRESSDAVVTQAAIAHRADAIYTKLLPHPADAGFFLREKPAML